MRFCESKNLVVVFPTAGKQGHVSRTESDDVNVAVNRKGMQEKLKYKAKKKLILTNIRTSIETKISLTVSACLACCIPCPCIDPDRSTTKINSVFCSASLKLGTKLSIKAEVPLSDFLKVKIFF